MEVAEFILVWALRLFGVLWIVGGIFTIHQARTSAFLDRAIGTLEEAADRFADGDDHDSLEPDSTLDVARSYLLLTGGVLTLASGAAMVITRPWMLVPLTLLIVHQGLYALRQHRRVKRAQSEDEAEEAAMSPQARNGAVTAVVVWLVAMSLVSTGSLQSQADPF